MTFAEDNEIVCETRLNVLYTYIYICKDWIQSRTLTDRDEKKSHYNSLLLFLSSYLLTVILNTLIFELLFLVILFCTGIYIGYFIIILILYLNRN